MLIQIEGKERTEKKTHNNHVHHPFNKYWSLAIETHLKIVFPCLDTNSLFYDIAISDPKLFMALSNKLNIFFYPSSSSSLNVAKGIGGTVSCSTLSSYHLRHCAPKCEVAQTPCCCLHPVCYRAEECGRIRRFKGVLRFIYIFRLIFLGPKCGQLSRCQGGHIRERCIENKVKKTNKC